jgi:hypothetical protein
VLARHLLDIGASTAPALLLVLPGFIATYVAQPGQHALTTRMLFRARRLLGYSALTAFAAAVVFVAVATADHTPIALLDSSGHARATTPPTPDPHVGLLRILWAPLIAVALLTATGLHRTWRLSSPPGHRGEWRRRWRMWCRRVGLDQSGGPLPQPTPLLDRWKQRRAQQRNG